MAHGCTGKGNDQVRFELGVKAFAPEMEVIAPWRIWDIQSRDEEIAYLEAHGIPVPMKNPIRTAATTISGTSATRGSISRILRMSRISRECSRCVSRLKKPPTRRNT